MKTVFETERLPLAIFLHATRRLVFTECRAQDRDGKVKFVFCDPDFKGLELELEFDRGASVPATSLFASQKFLRRKMSEAIENRRSGKDYDYESRRNH